MSEQAGQLDPRPLDGFEVEAFGLLDYAQVLDDVGAVREAGRWREYVAATVARWLPPDDRPEE